MFSTTFSFEADFGPETTLQPLYPIGVGDGKWSLAGLAEFAEFAGIAELAEFAGIETFLLSTHAR